MRHTFLRLSSISIVAATLLACGGSTVDTGNGTGDTGTPGVDGGSDSTLADGTTDAPGDGTSTDSTSTDSSTTDASTDVPIDDGAIGDGDAPPPVCSSEPTPAACEDCCGAEHKEGEKTFNAALLACACTDGICKTECATTACAATPTAPDDACRACLTLSVRPAGDAGTGGGPDGKCNGPVTSACSTDARCVAYAACLGTCSGA